MDLLHSERKITIRHIGGTGMNDIQQFFKEALDKLERRIHILEQKVATMNGRLMALLWILGIMTGLLSGLIMWLIGH